MIFQHYIYDASGERTLKGLGSYTIVNINGQDVEEAKIGNYSAYVSGYMVMGPHYQVTNHYYNGTERIACNLVGAVSGSENNSLELSGSEKASIPGRQMQDLNLVKESFNFNDLILEDEAPDQDDCEGNGDCPNALYFFHPDHIGSSTFLTDADGNPYQFLLYLPFGESMAEQKADGYSTKYRFTGTEFDEATNLYYFGARYYDPRISVWFGVDPLAEKYPAWNPYRYGFNNPIVVTDPRGMSEGDGDIYNLNGGKIGSDGKDDNKIYLKHTKSNSQLHPDQAQREVQNSGNKVETVPTEEVNVLIINKRTENGDDFTIGNFKTIGGDGYVEGDILEPAGPSTATPNIDKRIPEGAYYIAAYSSDKYPENFVISNSEVSEKRQILFHSGNTGAETTGCQLPGCKAGPSVINSRDKMEEIRNFINTNDVTKIIYLITR